MQLLRGSLKFVKLIFSIIVIIINICIVSIIITNGVAVMIAILKTVVLISALCSRLCDLRENSKIMLLRMCCVCFMSCVVLMRWAWWIVRTQCYCHSHWCRTHQCTWCTKKMLVQVHRSKWWVTQQTLGTMSHDDRTMYSHKFKLLLLLL